MTRVMYKKLEDGSLESKLIPSPKGNLVVTMKPNGTFVIYVINFSMLFISGNELSLDAAKKLAKEKLKEFGATFKEEVRQRHYTLQDEVLIELQNAEYKREEDEYHDMMGELQLNGEKND